MADYLKKLTVSSSPHNLTTDDTKGVMFDVILALIPALVMSVFVFGARALAVVCVSVISSVFFEWAYEKLMKKPVTIGDLSAVITGMLIAYVLPVTIPMWLPVIASAFAIVIVKQLYGGLGKNFMNPALAARAFMFSWSSLMIRFVAPHSQLPLFAGIDKVVTSATPLASMKNGALPDVNLAAMFTGNIAGCIGETSVWCLLAGGIYLAYRKVISLRIPLSYLGTVFIIGLLFPQGNNPLMWATYQISSGGLMLGAFFMATDYASSPSMPVGQIIYGIGCGLLTMMIRYFGSYPEGVTYAILIMNTLAWMLDRKFMPRKFGYASAWSNFKEKMNKRGQAK